jgi:hypothetical protein
MATYSTNKYASGAALTPSVPPGTLIAIDFDTAVSPGANVGAAVVLTAVAPDIIGLCWIPANAVIEGYNIDIGDMDSGATLVFELQDGAGNVYQAAVTTGQAGGKITAASAAVRMIGVAQTYTAAQAYLALVVTVAATGASGAGGRVSGSVLLRKL